MPRFERLRGDIRTDVLIVGGGMAGLMCAYMLTERGVDCVIAEAGTVCSGVTKNTTAKITFQHGAVYEKLIRMFGTEKARMYLEANRDALARYKEMCADIDCGFEEKDLLLYTKDNTRVLERELEALGKLGYGADFTRKLPVPFPAEGAVRIVGQAQFHPLRFAAAIAPQLNIYEHTRVLGFDGNTAATDGGKITFDAAVIASHFPFIDRHGGYFMKMYQQRSYVLALENAPDTENMYVDEAPGGISVSSYRGLLIVSGGGGRTGKTNGAWKDAEDFSAQFYPSAHVKYRWAAQDCMTLDSVPYIGRYSKGTQNMYVATGFNKWGMTSSMAAASVLADTLTGRESPYAPVFSPSRSVLHPQLAKNVAEAAVNLLTPTGKRCTHMCCALKWNENEGSWDCPCHGSRFHEDGSVIIGPAYRNLGEKRRLF